MPKQSIVESSFSTRFKANNFNRLYQEFQSFRLEKYPNRKTTLNNPIAFSTWLNECVTLNEKTYAYSFIVTDDNAITSKNLLVVPSALIGFYLKTTVIPTKTPQGFYLDFKYRTANHRFGLFKSVDNAQAFYHHFGLLEVEKDWASREHSLEKELIQKYLGLDFRLKEKASVSRKKVFNANTKNWQYKAWLEVKKYLDELNDPLRYHHGLASYETFIPTIHKAKRDFNDPKGCLVINPFHHYYLDVGCIYYLPKQLKMALEQYYATEDYSPSQLGTKYRVRCRDAEGKIKHIGNYLTIEEAKAAYKNFKELTIKNIFKNYVGKLASCFIREFNYAFN